MSIGSALLLIVGSSFAWAGLDMCRKVMAGRMAPVPLLLTMTSLTAPIFLLWAVSSGAPRPWVHATAYWAPALLSVGLNVAANLLYFRAVAASPFSQMVPLLALTPVFAALAAVPLVGEVPGARVWAGIVMVTGGAIALQVPSAARGGGVVAWIRAFRAEPGALPMSGVAILWALATALDKASIAHAEPLFHGALLNGLVGLTVAPVLIFRGRLGELAGVRRIAWPLAGALVVGVVALGLQLRALHTAPVSLVETLKRGLGCLLALVIGRLVFAERLTWSKVVAVSVMAAGVAAILL
jgi:drug/metabolite transporter (DMT)-like permease